MRSLRAGGRAAFALAIAAAALGIARALLGLSPSLESSHPSPAILLATAALGGAFLVALALTRKTEGRSGGEAP